MCENKRLIDANALLAELDKFSNPMPNQSGYEFLRGIAAAITEIEDAHTVDAVEVVHGRWVPESYNYGMGELTLFRCSECDTPNAFERNYCHNCGAKMEGSGNA